MRVLIHAGAALALLVAASLPSAAEEPPPFMRALYPPDLVMRHARDVGLESSQRKAITKAVTDTQAATLELKWEMQEAAQSLAELVEPPRVDEKSAIAAASRVMEIEARVKQAHLALLVRIKNVLSADQQRALDALRDREGG